MKSVGELYSLDHSVSGFGPDLLRGLKRVRNSQWKALPSFQPKLPAFGRIFSFRLL